MTDRSHPPRSPYTAYLRVYEPLAAFPDGERTTWTAYAGAAGGSAADRVALVRAERRSDLVRMISIPPRPVPAEEPAEAYVLEIGGVRHLCPVQSRLRSWLALGEFRDGLPDTVLHAFVPPVSLAEADAEHAVWGRGADPWVANLPAPRILTATWSVPVPWFVPFVPADRVQAERGQEVAQDLDGLYRTRMSSARRRLARALRSMHRHLADLASADEEDLVEDTEEIGQWLEEFHPRSWVELDLGGLATLLHDDQAASGADLSVAEVAGSLAALELGDLDGAALTYRSLLDRWSAVAALSHAS